MAIMFQLSLMKTSSLLKIDDDYQWLSFSHVNAAPEHRKQSKMSTVVQ